MKEQPAIAQAFRDEWIKAPPREVYRGPRQQVGERDLIELPAQGYTYVIEQVSPGGASEEVGLHVGDQIELIDGKPIHWRSGLVFMVQVWQGTSHRLDILTKHGVKKQVMITPRWSEEHGRWLCGLAYAYKLAMLRGTHKDENMAGRVVYPMELFDAEMQRIVRGHVELGPEQRLNKYEAASARREVKRFVLYVKDEGGGEEGYDVLARFNRVNAKVYWEPDLKTAGVCRERGFSIEVAIQDLSSPMTVHTLIHELRHGYQHQAEQDERFGIFLGAYEDATRKNFADEKLMDLRIRDAEGVNEFKNILATALGRGVMERLCGQVLRDWEGLARAYQRALHDSWSLNGQADNWEQEHAEIANRLQAIEAALPTSASKVFGEVTVKDVFQLPTLIIERDAEYGALLGLRALKKETGVDLLQPLSFDGMASVLDGLEFSEMTRAELMKTISSKQSVKSYMELIGLGLGCITRDMRVMKAREEEREEEGNVLPEAA